jgi:tetratricopeptide (TPR) repeat protein
MSDQHDMGTRQRSCIRLAIICGVALLTNLVKAQESNSLTDDEHGIASIRSNDWQNAIISFSEAIKGNPKDALAYEYRGEAYFAKGDFDHAIGDLTKAIQFDPKNARGLCLRGAAYRAKGKFKPAIHDLSEALRLCPTNDYAYKQRASVYNVMGRFDEAIADWDAGLHLNPQDPTAWAMRGFAYAEKGQYERALSDFTKAIQLDPLNHPALNNLAWLRATCPNEQMRNGKEAVAEATKACELTGWADWTRIDTLAVALAEAGDFAKAVDYQKRALKMSEVTKADRLDMQHRLALYERQQPYRGGPPR